MATPTFAEASTQLKNGIKPLTDLEAAVGTIVTSIDTAEQDLEGDFLPGAVVGTLAGLRARLSIALSWAQARALWDAWVLEVLRVAGLPNDDAWARVHRYMHDNSLSFNDRNWTRGSPSAGGSNVGTGTLKRLTVDWEAYNLQGGAVETKTFYCDVDQNLGVLKGNERFVCRGEDASKDNLDWQGSGIAFRPVYSRHSGTGEGGSLLRNSSWDATFTGTGTDKIPDWTIGGTASKITAGTSGYRTAPGSSSQGTLVFDNDAAATNEVTQALSVQRLNAGSERKPWMLYVAYKKSNSGATGTLNLKMGSKTTALDLSTISDTDWHQLFFTIDKNVYYRNWREDAPDIEVEVVNLSAGTLTLDDLYFGEWTYIDGTYWLLAGGATAFLERDVFTAADSGPAASTSEMMYSAYRAGVFSDAIVNLPVNNAGSETVTDP